MKKALSILGLLSLGVAGYIYLGSSQPKDLCQNNQLKVSQLEIGTEDRDRLRIHLGFSFDSKTNKFLRHVKNAKKTIYYSKYKYKPELTSLSTEFKSKRVAKKAYRYLKWKWKKNKKNQYDVALKDKTVTFFGNSKATPQCFYKKVASTKRAMGINPETGKKKKRHRMAKKKKKRRSVATKKKSKRRLASVSR